MSFLADVTMSTLSALSTLFVFAIVTVELHTIPQGLSALNWLSYFLYLPQVMYVLIFGWLIVTGPGRHSIDHYLVRVLGLENGTIARSTIRSSAV